MTNYSIEKKEAFNVVGVGFEITSDYRDFAGIAKEKSSFWQKIMTDGTFEQLKAIADNAFVFAVSEAVNGKMMYYAGVLSDKPFEKATRNIQFPAGSYVVVKGTAGDSQQLSEQLTGATFGEVLGQVEDFSYVGGPNAAVEMGTEEDGVFGEMWVPVVQK